MGIEFSHAGTTFVYLDIIFELVHTITSTRTTTPAPLKVIYKLVKEFLEDRKHKERLAKKEDILGWRPPDALRGPVVTDIDLLESLGRYLDFANSGYDTIKPNICCTVPIFDVDKVSKAINVKPEDIIVADANNHIKERPFFICIDRHEKRITVNVRGTGSLTDAIIDGVSLSKIIAPGVAAHLGAHDSALVILDKIQGAVIKAFKETGYPLVFIGHSLGAAVASLCAWEIMNYPLTNRAEAKAIRQVVGDKVSALCFCCPPVLTMNACEAASSFITCIANKRDPVVRTSVVNVWQCLARIRRDKGPGEDIPLPAEDESNCFNVKSCHSIPTHLPVGSLVIYPMYAPGRLLHLVPVRNEDPSNDQAERVVASIDPMRPHRNNFIWIPGFFGANVKKDVSCEAFDKAASEAKIEYELVGQADGMDRWSILTIEPVHLKDHLLESMAPIMKGIINRNNSSTKKSGIDNSDQGPERGQGLVFPGSNKVHPGVRSAY